jgi:hypothetical protein
MQRLMMLPSSGLLAPVRASLERSMTQPDGPYDGIQSVTRLLLRSSFGVYRKIKMGFSIPFDGLLLVCAPIYVL